MRQTSHAHALAVQILYKTQQGHADTPSPLALEKAPLRVLDRRLTFLKRHQIASILKVIIDL